MNIVQVNECPKFMEQAPIDTSHTLRAFQDGEELEFISSLLNTRLHEELTCTGYWEYLESKHNWTTATLNLIA